MVMRTFLWFMAIIGALIGAAVLAFGTLTATGAPQQAAAAAIAVGLAVIPYCLARAASELALAAVLAKLELRSLDGVRLLESIAKASVPKP